MSTNSRFEINRVLCRSLVVKAVLPALVLSIILGAWYLTARDTITFATIAVYQQTQLEIVESAARSAAFYVQDRSAADPSVEMSVLEQEILRRFIDPIQLLNNGDAWIYAPTYVVFDLSADFPDEYRGKSMAEIFSIQRQQGASHYEEMTDAVMNARAGTGWYIWLPEKGREIASWTPVRVGPYVWTIGLSTPLDEILDFIGVTQQMQLFGLSMVIVALIVFVLLALAALGSLRRQQAQAAIEQLNSKLEQRVVARTAELAAANERLTELDNLKSKFISDVSHELRTPVTAMRTTLYLMKRSPADQARYVDNLDNQIKRLSVFLQHVLDLSRLEAGRDTIQSQLMNLNALVSDVLKSLMSKTEIKDLALSFESYPDLPPLHGDCGQLDQVVTNLVSNALNYTHAPA